MNFKLKAKFKPAGDQPKVIHRLTAGLKKKHKFQTLLGVTGSGKTFTVANVIQNVQKPTLVIAHNKTLAAQLTSEFRQFFPDNAVEYFVSYYDYYQPEAYLPNTDTYIEKEVEINEEIDRLRHAATSALLSRRDVIIVASVSCIYGLGSPQEYKETILKIEVGERLLREELLTRLVNMYFIRTEILKRGTFRAHGGVVEIMPAEREVIIRVEIENDVVAKITELEGLTHKIIHEDKIVNIFPAKHFVVHPLTLEKAMGEIERELVERLKFFRKEGKLLEAERLEQRTRNDLAMMREIGYCNGIENYSRYLTGRASGQAPYTLLDFFPKNLLIVIDESHVTVPQIGGMYEGDKSRKLTLIEHGFRLPSALDNRPLKFDEFKTHIRQAIFTSATPGYYELQNSSQITEQIVRPTGLVDPKIIVKPATNQVEDLISEIKKELEVNPSNKILVTTLTKRAAENLTTYLEDLKFRVKYLHSEVDTLERIQILDDLRKGEFDILVGINLLREGLDLPEVSLVAILDADKEGFLRSKTSLIQTMGRAARNIQGRVILYADRITKSMNEAIREASRRRKIQLEYNKKHGVTPQSIQKAIKSIIDYELKPEPMPAEYNEILDIADVPRLIAEKTTRMKELARDLKFEEAALLRDEITQLKKIKSPLTPL